jgi:hypothetical protein
MHPLAARPDGSVRPGDLGFYRRAGIALSLRARDGILFARRAQCLRTNPGACGVAAREGMTADGLARDVCHAARSAAIEE